MGAGAERFTLGEGRLLREGEALGAGWLLREGELLGAERSTLDEPRRS